MNDEQPRLTAHEIYEHVVKAGREELTRPVGQRVWSGVAGGLLMGLSGLGVALMRSFLGDGEGARLASFALYPAGFIAVIVGRAQLFTENTLFPVGVVLREPARLTRLFLLWAVVLGCNRVGAFLFTLPVSHFLRWLAMAVLGNAVGGVGLVSLLNYGQVETSSEPSPPPL